MRPGGDTGPSWTPRRAATGGVMVLPGLVNSDRATVVLRRYLTGKGYRVHGWGLGRNLGIRSVGREAERLIARLESLADAAPVTLIGISLGGIIARMVAQARPDLVAGSSRSLRPMRARRGRPMSGVPSSI
ncbi:hypothetical protein P0F65_19500 [Sphingomonas sp. I4]